MSESPHMIVKSKTYDYDIGFNSLLSGTLTVVGPLGLAAPFVVNGGLPEIALLAIAGAGALLSPCVAKFSTAADARRYNDDLAGLSLRQAGPTFRETKELISRDTETGEEVHLIRNWKQVVIETHTPEKPGKTWDRVYESLLKVHDLKETDFLVYTEVEDDSGSEQGKLLPLKHSINKAMAFTGYGIVCDCKACSK